MSYLALAGLISLNVLVSAGTQAASPQVPHGGTDESASSPASSGHPQAFALEESQTHDRKSAEAASLVENSKQAIIKTGISEAYFKKHFTLLKSVDEPSDKRVEWSYSVNEYEAQLVDAIGFHTTGGTRVYVHGIKNQLYSTHEIVKTLPRTRARTILRSCIGEFEAETTTYRALTVPGKARLYLTGRSKIKQHRPTQKAQGEQGPQFFYVGFVDVENGKCVKKLGKVSL